MRRWRGSRAHLKWLLPGMGVKRWLLLLIAGFMIIGLGVAMLPEALGPEAWRRVAVSLRPFFPTPVLQVTLLFVAGLALVASGVFGLNRSLLSAVYRNGQGDLVDVVYRHRQRQRGPKIVAIGGGHGLNTLLRGLKAHTDKITAIVTVADDGGSSGRLRRDLGMLPPGDFRNCIAALSDAEGLMTQLFQYRFGDEGGLEGHSFGNLYITAMAAITGSFEAALNESSRVLAVRGRVIPSTLAQVTLCADVLSPASDAAGAPLRRHRVCGESQLGALLGRIQRVYLDPEDAPAYPEAIRAILDADLVVIGPGSLYSSVLPNLLVHDLAQALAASRALRVYVCNVATQPGETGGYDVSAHVHALREHVKPDPFDMVLANDMLSESRSPGAGSTWVQLCDPETLDYELVTRDLVDYQHPWRHDSVKLAQAIMELVSV